MTIISSTPQNILVKDISRIYSFRITNYKLRFIVVTDDHLSRKSISWAKWINKIGLSILT